MIGPNRVPRVNRLRHYFDQHPEASRKESLGSATRPALSAEEIIIHAWLTGRLAMFHYERHGLWPRLRRFLLGNRLVRWLGWSPRRTGNERSR